MGACERVYRAAGDRQVAVGAPQGIQGGLYRFVSVCKESVGACMGFRRAHGGLEGFTGCTRVL